MMTKFCVWGQHDDEILSGGSMMTKFCVWGHHDDEILIALRGLHGKYAWFLGTD
jgi:hypothetical protein